MYWALLLIKAILIAIRPIDAIKLPNYLRCPIIVHSLMAVGASISVTADMTCSILTIIRRLAQSNSGGVLTRG